MVSALSFKNTAVNTASERSPPTTVLPCPRIRIAALVPRFLTRGAPPAESVTSIIGVAEFVADFPHTHLAADHRCHMNDSLPFP